jgi:hypothetical protein
VAKIPIEKIGEKNMKRMFLLLIARVALGIAAFGFQTQNRPQQAAPNADPLMFSCQNVI